MPLKMSRAQLADLYRQAAERIDDELSDYSCLAVENVALAAAQSPSISAAQQCAFAEGLSKRYARIFQPFEVESMNHPAWGEDWARRWPKPQPSGHYAPLDGSFESAKEKVKACRVMALLLMADMVEAGDA